MNVRYASACRFGANGDGAIQFHPSEEGDETRRHHRLYAVWSFNFTLVKRAMRPADTTGFMPCGPSISAFLLVKSGLPRYR
jgi:hypothetical protein